jgi:hypothetical protein
VSDINDWLRHDSTGSGRRKIFAIVTPPMPADRGCKKTIRRILIFDNHPHSLRLVSGQRLNPDVDLATGRVRVAAVTGLAAPRPASHLHVILGLVLIMTLVLAMFWPLFVR